MSIVKPPCDEALILTGHASKSCSKSRGRWILAATILGSSMSFIDGTVVNVALPALQQNLNATATDVQWVVEAYALFLAALLLLGGSLGDLFGRRLIYAIGISVFALASLWCGLAPNVQQLIIARAVQGIGGALLVPGSLAIISASFAEEDRGQAIGTWSGSTAITTALGPVLGGWLIENVSWRAVFFLNLPLAVVVLLIVFRFVPESRDEADAGKLDLLGAALATLGLGGLVYGLIESARLGFRSPIVIGSLIAGVVILIGFVTVEARRRSPMMPLSLFRSRDFAGANLLTLFLYAALSGSLFFLPLNLIQVQGYSSTAAGAAILPFILIMFLLSRWSGGLIKRYGSRLPLVIGPLLATIGFALFLRPRVGGSYWTTFFPAVVVLGIGMAISVAPLTTTVMNSVSESRAGIASGVNNAVSRTAGLLSIAVLGVIMFQTFNWCLDKALAQVNLPQEIRQTIESDRIKLAAMELPSTASDEMHNAFKQVVKDCFVAGFRRVMLIAAVLAVASSVAAFLIRRRDARSPA
ncbi:MAG TPA: DHA2 family efflux MFS transporter permease subunit [Pyrinomonadaceae bacterium]|nr:DHA2 family efflux MFS transporter permease subunit [Pyrinomonadaceae bacterium]